MRNGSRYDKMKKIEVHLTYVKANSNKNKGTSDTEFHWEHIKTNFLLKCSLEPKLTQ